MQCFAVAFPYSAIICLLSIRTVSSYKLRDHQNMDYFPLLGSNLEEFVGLVLKLHFVWLHGHCDSVVSHEQLWHGGCQQQIPETKQH